MTADAALEEIESYVQECRENGETDLRSILHAISSLRKKCVAESIKSGLLPNKEAKVPEYDVLTEGYDLKKKT